MTLLFQPNQHCKWQVSAEIYNFHFSDKVHDRLNGNNEGDSDGMYSKSEGDSDGMSRNSEGASGVRSVYSLYVSLTDGFKHNTEVAKVTILIRLQDALLSAPW